VVARSDGLRIAVIATAAPDAVAAALAKNPRVAFVEANGPTTWDLVAPSSTRWDLTSGDKSSQWDSTRWDQTSTDSAQWDSSQWDSSQWDSSQWDSSQWDATGWQSSQWDSSRWDSSQWDSSQWDATGWSASNWDASNWDASNWDASNWDASNWDASNWDASNWDASNWDAAVLTAEGTGTSSQGASDPLLGKQWGIRAVNLTGAFHHFKAKNTQKLCIVDSGVDHAHPDLSSRMWREPSTGIMGWDFVNGDGDPMDDAGHGTHVAGIAAAAIQNGRGIAGASPERIIAVKVLDANGVGTEANLALGIEFCADKGASVISMSLGTPEDSPAVYRAVRYAHERGVVMVASIGNLGGCTTCVRFPAAYSEVVAVAALRPDGTTPKFSSVSDAVDFAAPGVVIVSTFPGSRYASFNGTSMATPFVAAAAGLLMDAQPDLNATDTLRLLAETARDLGPSGKDPFTGYGAINVGKALQRAMAKEWES
ncbi:MAG TPA: S8 family serine peptidase, partial [Candidatus Thermoplasmatota archaeon]|nr:S8 family serine peptidase [Candidatus Thermoplasmatota archaeon]